VETKSNDDLSGKSTPEEEKQITPLNPKEVANCIEIQTE